MIRVLGLKDLNLILNSYFPPKTIKFWPIARLTFVARKRLTMGVLKRKLPLILIIIVAP